MTIYTGPILLVEDIRAVRELIDGPLMLPGYRVRTARDGQDVLRAIEAEVPAVVLTDIPLPRLDGFALAHRLRKDPHMARVALRVLSAAHDTVADEHSALALGAMRILRAPVDSDERFGAFADVFTGYERSTAPMSERDFYGGNRERLRNKLHQKSAQVARRQPGLENLPIDQRDTYRSLLSEAPGQYDEIQREQFALPSLRQEPS